jgi:hypothetical protein
MKDHTVLELLEILSSSRIRIDALTTRVAIFGVLQHAHASATEGDEFGIEYVRAFLAQLKQRTAEHRKVLKISLVLQQKLQEKCDRIQSQIRSFGTLSSLTSPSLESRPAATADPQDPTAGPVREQSTHKNGLSLQQEILGIEPGAPVPNEPAAKRHVNPQIPMVKTHSGKTKRSPANHQEVQSSTTSSLGTQRARLQLRRARKALRPGLRRAQNRSQSSKSTSMEYRELFLPYHKPLLSVC